MKVNLEVLKKMANNPACALELGKAAEHIACADLMLRGYRCYLSDQGLPYDMVVDVDGRLVRVQVKATCFARDRNSAGKKERIAYSWSIRNRGKLGKGERLSDRHCDIVALVALDIGIVAYLPLSLCAQGLRLCPPGYELQTKFTSGSQWSRNVDQFPFDEAISGDLSKYKTSGRQRTHCIHGHEFTPENTYRTKVGSTVCRKCYQSHARGYAKQRRQVAKEAAVNAAPQLVF